MKAVSLAFALSASFSATAYAGCSNYGTGVGDILKAPRAEVCVGKRCDLVLVKSDCADIHNAWSIFSDGFYVLADVHNGRITEVKVGDTKVPRSSWASISCRAIDEGGCAELPAWAIKPFVDPTGD